MTESRSLKVKGSTTRHDSWLDTNKPIGFHETFMDAAWRYHSEPEPRKGLRLKKRPRNG